MPHEIKSKKNGLPTGDTLFNLGDQLSPEDAADFFEKIRGILGPSSVYMDDDGPEREAGSRKKSKRRLKKKKKSRRSSDEHDMTDDNHLHPQLANETSVTPNSMTELLAPGAPEVMAEGPSLPVTQFAIPKRA